MITLRLALIISVVGIVISAYGLLFELHSGAKRYRRAQQY